MSMITSAGSRVDRLKVFSQESFAEVQRSRGMIAASQSGIDRLIVTDAVEEPYSDDDIAGGLPVSENSQESKLSEASRPCLPIKRPGLVVRLFPTPPHVFGVSQHELLEHQEQTTETHEGSKLPAIETKVLSLSRILKSLQPLDTFPKSSESSKGWRSSPYQDTEERVQDVGVDGFALETELLNFNKMLKCIQPLETFPGSSEPSEGRHLSGYRDTQENVQEGEVDGIALKGAMLNLSTMLQSLQPMETHAAIPISGSAQVSPKLSRGRYSILDRTTEATEATELEVRADGVLHLSKMFSSVHPPESFPGFPAVASSVEPVSSQSSHSRNASQDRDTEETQPAGAANRLKLKGKLLDLSTQSHSLEAFPASASTVKPVSPSSSQERDTVETQQGAVDSIALEGEVTDLGRQLKDSQPLETFSGFATSASTPEPVYPGSSQESDTEETQQGEGVNGMAMKGGELNFSRKLKSLQPLEIFPRYPTLASPVGPVHPEASQARDTETTLGEIGVDSDSFDISPVPEEPVSPELSHDSDTEETFPGFPIATLRDEHDQPSSSQGGDWSHDRDVDEFPGFMQTFPRFRHSPSIIEISSASSQNGDSNQARDIKETEQGVGVHGSRAGEKQGNSRPDPGHHQWAAKGKNESCCSGGVLTSNLPASKFAKWRGSTSSSSIDPALESQVRTIDIGMSNALEPSGAPHSCCPVRCNASEQNHKKIKSQERDSSVACCSGHTLSGETLFKDVKKKSKASEPIEPNVSDVVKRLKAAYLDVKEDDLLSSMVPPEILALDLHRKDYSIAMEYYGPPITYDGGSVGDLPKNSSNVRLPRAIPYSTSKSSGSQVSVMRDANPFAAGIQRFRERNKREIPPMLGSSQQAGNPSTSRVPIIRTQSRTASRVPLRNADTVQGVLEPDQVKVSVLGSLASNSLSDQPSKLKWWSKSVQQRS